MADVLDSASEKISGTFVGEPEVEAEIRRSLGMAYLNIGRWRQAEKQLAPALTLRKQALGLSHDKTIQSIQDLKLANAILGDSRAYLELERERVSAMTLRSGSDDPKESMSHSEMAYALEDVGELNEAQTVAREIWETNVEFRGESSEEALTSQAHYSWVLMKNGRSEQAEKIALDALTRSTETLGSDHETTSAARSATAAAYIAQGKIDQARALYGDRELPENIDIEMAFQGDFDANTAPFQMLVFFEEWCPFSQNALPRVEETYRQYRAQGLDVIGFTKVNRSSTDAAVEQLLTDKEISFTAVKETGRLWTYFKTQSTPSFRLLHNGFLIWEAEINLTDPIPVRMIEGLVASQQ